MFAEVERYGCGEDVRPVCLVYAELLAFGYVYRGGRGGAVRVPVDREECDCARSRRLAVLSNDVLNVGGRLGVVGP